MINQLVQFLRYNALRSDKRLSAGIWLSLANAIVSLLIVMGVFSTGQRIKHVDVIDVFFEGSSVMIALITFALISFIRISISIKAPFLLGLFLIQIGRTLDTLDEVIFYEFAEWSAVGDGLAFLEKYSSSTPLHFG